MKKETFVKAIESIEKQYRHDVEVAHKLESVFPECYAANMLYDNHNLTNALVLILQEEMNDTDLCDQGLTWIEWFCWETDFGKKSKKMQAYREGGEIIKMDNANDLYDYLIEKR